MTHDVRQAVLGIAAEVLNRAVDPVDTLFDLGADSLIVVELLIRLQTDLGCEVDMSGLTSGVTLGEFADELASAIAGAP